MRFFLAIFIFLLYACKDEAMLALNSKEPIHLSYSAKEQALKGLNEPFMLFFYTKDCGVCAKQIPILNELSKDYKIIAVLGGMRDYDMAKESLKGVTFATIYESLDVEYLSNVVGGVWGVPAMFVYDKDGKMVKKFISLTPKSVLENELNMLI
ncbi:conjugal transfer protein TraF [Campylobacter sp. RM9333]|uniref:TlpA family protein disulfide reductase n=1 Tax=Campylobacter sp. RM9333 TaxID=2735731 RepID=UPI001DCD924F|nr:conjugal transfer protein TraF [Campylobacter sp. RM9333]